ncbi:maleylacetoacetate isomerase [Beijerinckia sp. L45]|uniref:maleylacetoacetate isomerase n=1 Tax=Beijerinckia sp. L45 TaxID=1641855 RepID=UPI00131C4FC5|nr:maleylacetoacetate isomerase [Beijerinckia sp. L45]
MDIYGFWRSQATFRVRIALNLKRVAYREIPIDLDKGEQYSPEFLAINPQGALPALIEDAASPLTQSSALLEYIEERYPTPPLLPKNLRERARVRSLAAVAISDTHPLITPRVKGYLSKTAGFDADQWRAWQTNWFSAGLKTLEARLAHDPATGTFCQGDTPGIADICLYALYEGAGTFKIKVDAIPAVDRIVAHCAKLPAFADAHPTRQADYPG